MDKRKTYRRYAKMLSKPKTHDENEPYNLADCHTYQPDSKYDVYYAIFTRKYGYCSLPALLKAFRQDLTDMSKFYKHICSRGIAAGYFRQLIQNPIAKKIQFIVLAGKGKSPITQFLSRDRQNDYTISGIVILKDVPNTGAEQFLEFIVCGPGVGRGLFEECVKLATQFGYDALILEAVNDEVKRRYLDYGFVVLGKRKRGGLTEMMYRITPGVFTTPDNPYGNPAMSGYAV